MDSKETISQEIVDFFQNRWTIVQEIFGSFLSPFTTNVSTLENDELIKVSSEEVRKTF